MRRVLLLLLACALALTLVPLAATRASRDGEAGSLAQQARAVERQLAGLERQVAGMERSSGRFDRWLGCIRWMPVSEYGDADARDGYRYDDQDGSGPGYRAALAVDTARPRQPDFMLLSLRRRAGCDSSPTLPGGSRRTGHARRSRAPARPAGPTRRACGAHVRALRRMGVVPVLGAGDRARRRRASASATSSVPSTTRRRAIALRSRSTPAPGTTPTTSCSRSPVATVPSPPASAAATRARESTDVRRLGLPLLLVALALGVMPAVGVVSAERPGDDGQRERLRDLRQDLASLREDVEDLREPVAEFERFDQCMFAIGVTQRGAAMAVSATSTARAVASASRRSRSTRAAITARTTTCSPSPARSRRRSSATRTPAARGPTNDRAAASGDESFAPRRARGRQRLDLDPSRRARACR